LTFFCDFSSFKLKKVLQKGWDKHPNPDKPFGAKRKSRFSGELKIEDLIFLVSYLSYRPLPQRHKGTKKKIFLIILCVLVSSWQKYFAIKCKEMILNVLIIVHQN